MEENILERCSPYSLATDIEDIMTIIRKEVSEEDYRLVLDLIQILRLRTDRLEKKMKEELA